MNSREFTRRFLERIPIFVRAADFTYSPAEEWLLVSKVSGVDEVNPPTEPFVLLMSEPLSSIIDSQMRSQPRIWSGGIDVNDETAEQLNDEEDVPFRHRRALYEGQEITDVVGRPERAYEPTDDDRRHMEREELLARRPELRYPVENQEPTQEDIDTEAEENYPMQEVNSAVQEEEATQGHTDQAVESTEDRMLRMVHELMMRQMMARRAGS